MKLYHWDCGYAGIVTVFADSREEALKVIPPDFVRKNADTMTMLQEIDIIEGNNNSIVALTLIDDNYLETNYEELYKY